MHVDALDRAAALAGVVHGAVGERFGGRFRVGIVGDIGRILAAELELEPHHARSHRLRDLRAGRHRAGEEDAVDTLIEQRRADVAGADDGDEHVGRDARRMQQAVDVQPGQRRELRRLVEHRVAGQQRGDEHVAADEVRIVPGRDVGDDAERVVADALGHAALAEDRLVLRRRLDLGEEEVDAGEKAVQFVPRLRQRLADFLGQGLRQRLELGGDGEAKARDRDRPLGERRRLPRGLRPARALRLGGDAGGVVGGHFGERRAVGGVDDLQGLHAVFAARAAARKSASSGASSSVPSPRRWNSGCHWTAAM